MSRLVVKEEFSVMATVQLSESELAALEALACYGTDEFLRVFYEKLGRSYLEPHAVGLRSLFAMVRVEAPVILARAKKAREAFKP